MIRRIELALCALLACAACASAGVLLQKTAREWIGESYLDLLQSEGLPALSNSEVKAVDKELRKELETEQGRLKKKEAGIGSELKAARKQLSELNKKASRDDSDAAKQRTWFHCEVLRLEAELAKTRNEREHALPILHQNRSAKLELIQKWPAIKLKVEESLETGTARTRRYGDVDDIGIRDLGIDDLSEKQARDVKTGQDAIREMESQGLMPPRLEDKVVTAYIKNLAENIANHSDLRIPVKVAVLDSMEINAFALPGGFLFVNGGLINQAETEAELAGVLAHEIAHAAARHGPRLMKRATITDLLFQAAQVGAMVLTGGGSAAYYALQYGFYGVGMVLDLTLLGVSREYEEEADQLGVQYAWRAGYDPAGFITFFDQMASEAGYVKSTSFFRTHPPFLARIVSTFSEIAYLPPKPSLRLDSSEFLEIKKSVRTLIHQREREHKDHPSLRGEPAECGSPDGKLLQN